MLLSCHSCSFSDLELSIVGHGIIFTSLHTMGPPPKGTKKYVAYLKKQKERRRKERRAAKQKYLKEKLGPRIANTQSSCSGATQEDEALVQDRSD